MQEMAKGRVLLVDDESAVVRTYARALRRAGFVVESAEEGAAATALLEAGDFDAVISDIGMPGVDGVAMLRAARDRDPDLPVMLMTGTPELETAIRAVELGALRYLVKPVDAELLTHAVADAVRLRRVAHMQRQAVELYRRAAGDATARATLEERFERALGRLEMVYQPIVSWSQRAPIAYEALLRSHEPTLDRPDRLLDAAEQLGRLHQLGQAIRAEVAASVDAAPEGALLFVNLHSSDLDDEQLFWPGAPLARAAGRVVLEMTERASLAGIGDVRARVLELRRLGYRIAVDDLGAGYAGLTSFAQLQPDVVKLDMSLVRGVELEPTKRKLIRSICQVCQELDITLVTEGVETANERDALLELGCDVFQGYLFARPGPPFPVPQF